MTCCSITSPAGAPGISTLALCRLSWASRMTGTPSSFASSLRPLALRPTRAETVSFLDRALYGRVTDFIVWKIGRHPLPAFNLADAALCAGVGLFALHLILSRAEAPPDS